MNKNNAVIMYYFQNTVSSIIHVSNTSKQFLNKRYLQTFWMFFLLTVQLEMLQ